MPHMFIGVDRAADGSVDKTSISVLKVCEHGGVDVLAQGFVTRLEPCPFCGAEARLNDWLWKGRKIDCVEVHHKEDCFLYQRILVPAGTEIISAEELAKRWNNRSGKAQG